MRTDIGVSRGGAQQMIMHVPRAAMAMERQRRRRRQRMAGFGIDESAFGEPRGGKLKQPRPWIFGERRVEVDDVEPARLPCKGTERIGTDSGQTLQRKQRCVVAQRADRGGMAVDRDGTGSTPRQRLE